MSEPTPTAEATDAVDEPRGAGTESRGGATIPEQSAGTHARSAPVRPAPAAMPASAVAAEIIEKRAYSTPDWVRHPLSQRSGRPEEQQLPQQASPEHDDLELRGKQPSAPALDLIEEGHWVGPRGGRALVGTLVVLSLGCAAVGGIRIATTHSTTSIVLTLICLLVAAGIFAAMATSRPMVVDLRGTTLTVRHSHGSDSFDLTDPFQEVRVHGEPGTSGWMLGLRRTGGAVLVVDGRTVDSEELARVVDAARELAERRRSEREERFDR